MDADRELLLHCVSLLGKFISVKEPNIRYLGLVRQEGWEGWKAHGKGSREKKANAERATEKMAEIS